MRHPKLFLATIPLIIGGCADGTGPSQSAAEPTPGIQSGAPGPAVSAEIALEDATDRVLASVEGARSVPQLRDHLQDLRIALTTGDAPRGHRSILLARAVLQATAQESELAEFSAIELAIDQAEMELKGRNAGSELNSTLSGTSQ
jgi:hypothetical protein